MLVIRESQMQLLSARSQAVYADRIRNHIRSELPEDSDGLSEQELGVLIQQCIADAKQYGLESELDVCLYADIAIMLGVDFMRDRRYLPIRTLLEADSEPEVDSDPDLEIDAEPFADSESNPESEGSPSSRIEQAFDMAIDYAERQER